MVLPDTEPKDVREIPIEDWSHVYRNIIKQMNVTKIEGVDVLLRPVLADDPSLDQLSQDRLEEDIKRR